MDLQSSCQNQVKDLNWNLGFKIKFMRNCVEGAFTLKGLEVLNFASNFDELRFLKGKNFGQILLSMIFGQIQLRGLQVCNVCVIFLFVTFSFSSFLSCAHHFKCVFWSCSCFL